MKSSSLNIVLFACLTMLSACSTQPVEVKPYQQNLMKPCPGVLPDHVDGTAGTVLTTGVEWAKVYHDCKVRHNGLVEAINSRTAGER